jgi:hypothetical protein
LLSKELKSKLTLKDGRKITKAEAAIRQLCNKASSGDYKSGKLILDVTAKQQINSIAREFVDKLIKDGYITERHVKDYLNSGKILNTNSMPVAVYNLYRGSVVKKIKADMSVRNVLFLAYIWQMFYLSIYTCLVLEEVTNEYSFWEGFDRALDCLQIDEEKRKELINKAEKEREYKRPDDHLYDTAISAHLFMILQTRTSFINMRDVSKGIT